MFIYSAPNDALSANKIRILHYKQEQYSLAYKTQFTSKAEKQTQIKKKSAKQNSYVRLMSKSLLNK